jgi:hypothetical protein
MSTRAAPVLCWLRWLLVIPAVLVGWYLALASGLLLHSLVESFCPAEAMVSGRCYAPWFTWSEEALFVLTAGLAAWLVVLLPTLSCPTHKRTVATVAYLCGAVTAIVFAVTGPLWIPAIAALLAGLLTMRRVYRKHPRSGSQ